MNASDRESYPSGLLAGALRERGRSPALAQVAIDVDLLRKNERTLAEDEFSDEEAEAFGYC